jgi:hypothetical protein
MLGAAGPNWLGSPQHFVVGAVLAALLYGAARSRRIGVGELLAFVLAVSVVCTAELVWELVEYEVRYAGHFHYSAYYDTLADLANSAAGALVGAVAAVPLYRRFGRRAG